MSGPGEAPVPGGTPVGATCRRGHQDRRRRPTPFLCRHTILGGRRRSGRREGEREGIYVDRHGPILLFGALSLVLLNVLDAFFTLLFLSHGGQELNPIIDRMLVFGLWPFLLTKSVGVGICVAFLTMTKTFRAARIGLGILLGGYTALLCWHLVLLGRLG